MVFRNLLMATRFRVLGGTSQDHPDWREEADDVQVGDEGRGGIMKSRHYEIARLYFEDRSRKAVN